MKSAIFRKLFFFMVIIGIVPMIIFSFLTVTSYQELINKSIAGGQFNAQISTDTELNFKNITNQIILIFFLIAIFIIFFSIVFTRKFIYPIRKLIRGTEKLKHGNLNNKIIVKTGDEFEILADSFNQMALNLNKKIGDLEKSKKTALKALADLSKAEKTLEGEHEKTAAILNNFLDPIIVIDEANKISYINPAANEILGLTNNVLGKKIDITNNYSLENFRKIIKKDYTVKTSSELKDDSNTFEELVVKINGEDKIYKIITAKVLGEHKEHLGLMKIFVNLTREKAIDKMKSEFISIAAHQLRTPLSAIKWVIKMILDGDAGELSLEQQELLNKGYLSNERVIRLVNDLLNVSRIEEGKFGFNFESTDFKEVLDISISNIDSLIDKSHQELKIKIPPKLPKIFLDKERIIMVIQNLLSNAIKYTPEYGKIEVIVEVDKQYLNVKIKDQGVGIPAEDQPKLFSKFFRAANVVKLETEGSGLGLFMVKNIIEKHQGQVSLKSEEGKGTEVSFTLPINGVISL
jgi:two-component system sensor histidine kinase VicK